MRLQYSSRFEFGSCANACVALAFFCSITVGTSEIACAQPQATLAQEGVAGLSDQELRSLVVSMLKARMDTASNLRVISETVNWAGSGDKPSGEHWRQRYDHRQLGESYRNDVMLQPISADGSPGKDPILSISNFMSDSGEATMRADTVSTGGKPMKMGRVDSKHDNVLTGYPYQAFLLKHPLRSPKSHIPFLLSCENDWAIERGNGIVTITCPHRDWTGGDPTPGGVFRCELAVERGFCPSRITELSGDHEKQEKSWVKIVTEVKEWRQVDDIWFPKKFVREAWCDQYAPGERGVSEVDLLDIEIGKVQLADLAVPFDEGTRVVDAIRGVQFTIGPDGERLSERTLGKTLSTDVVEAPKSWRWLTVGINVLVVVSLLGVVLWKWNGRRTAGA